MARPPQPPRVWGLEFHGGDGRWKPDLASFGLTKTSVQRWVRVVERLNPSIRTRVVAYVRVEPRPRQGARKK